jgi:hypothetical protein
VVPMVSLLQRPHCTVHTYTRWNFPGSGLFEVRAQYNPLQRTQYNPLYKGHSLGSQTMYFLSMHSFQSNIYEPPKEDPLPIKDKSSRLFYHPQSVLRMEVPACILTISHTSCCSSTYGCRADYKFSDLI